MARPSLPSLLGYVVLGAYFGIVLVKSEVVSWFRIQEMFRFHSIHLYGVIGLGILTAMVSLWLLRRNETRALDGSEISLNPKDHTPGMVRYWAGGLLFGLGWALLGACPGPLYALVGTGLSVLLVAIASAIAGTYVYGLLRERLPH